MPAHSHAAPPEPSGGEPSIPELEPLAYHREAAELLQALEPASWTAIAGSPVGDAPHAELVRSAYRLEPAAHPRVAAAVDRASRALGVRVPVTVYQLEGETGTNASLLHAPGEAVIALSGNLLGLLDDAELTAVLGHELAHRLLWTARGGRFLVADRLLDLLMLDARTPPAYLETARRWNLATELYADRGALLACAAAAAEEASGSGEQGALSIAVRALVKVGTGLTDVDAAAFLAQADAADPASGSRAHSHPETVLRAWALARWAGAEQDPTGALLAPGLDLDALDLLDRDRLERLTRELVEATLTLPALRSDAVLAHARLFFPDAVPSAAEVSVPEQASASTRSYLAYVLLDLATVDPDAGDAGLLAVQGLADRAGLGPALAEATQRERLTPQPARAR